MLTIERLREALEYDPITGVFRWKIKPCGQINPGDIAGTRHNQGYWSIRLDGRIYLAHRLAWFHATGEWPSGLVDHEDLDRGNNAFSNLRQATKSLNAANSRAHVDGGSGIKGVVYRPSSGKWIASICIRGVRKHLGCFDHASDAQAAYARAAAAGFGAFARSGS